MQTITTCWHGEVWWFRVHLATNITFIVFFLTSSLHPLSPGIFTVCGSFGQLAALLCHDSTVKHGLASSSLCYHLQLWCFMYDILVSLIYKLESWEFDTLLCQKKERTRICHAKRWPTTNKFFWWYRYFWKPRRRRPVFRRCFVTVTVENFSRRFKLIVLCKWLETEILAKCVAFMSLFKGFKPDISFPKNSLSKFTSTKSNY